MAKLENSDKQLLVTAMKQQNVLTDEIKLKKLWSIISDIDSPRRYKRFTQDELLAFCFHFPAFARDMLEEIIQRKKPIVTKDRTITLENIGSLSALQEYPRIQFLANINNENKRKQIVKQMLGISQEQPAEIILEENSAKASPKDKQRERFLWLFKNYKNFIANPDELAEYQPAVEKYLQKDKSLSKKLIKTFSSRKLSPLKKIEIAKPSITTNFDTFIKSAHIDTVKSLIDPSFLKIAFSYFGFTRVIANEVNPSAIIERATKELLVENKINLIETLLGVRKGRISYWKRMSESDWNTLQEILKNLDSDKKDYLGELYRERLSKAKTLNPDLAKLNPYLTYSPKNLRKQSVSEVSEENSESSAESLIVSEDNVSNTEPASPSQKNSLTKKAPKITISALDLAHHADTKRAVLKKLNYSISEIHCTQKNETSIKEVELSKKSKDLTNANTSATNLDIDSSSAVMLDMSNTEATNLDMTAPPRDSANSAVKLDSSSDISKENEVKESFDYEFDRLVNETTSKTRPIDIPFKKTEAIKKVFHNNSSDSAEDLNFDESKDGSFHSQDDAIKPANNNKTPLTNSPNSDKELPNFDLSPIGQSGSTATILNGLQSEIKFTVAANLLTQFDEVAQSESSKQSSEDSFINLSLKNSQEIDSEPTQTTEKQTEENHDSNNSSAVSLSI